MSNGLVVIFQFRHIIIHPMVAFVVFGDLFITPFEKRKEKEYFE